VNIFDSGIDKKEAFMSRTNSKLEDFILTSRIMIENAHSDGEIRDKLYEYGYDEKKLLEARALHREVLVLFNEQKKEYSGQMDATEEMYQAWEEANKYYMKALKVARIAFQDNVKANAALMTGGERKKSLSGWLEQAGTFYSNLLSDLDFRKTMEQFGYTSLKLTREMALIAKVMEKAYVQTRVSGKAQEATEKRDIKLNELDKWVSNFRVIAKVALEECPQKLEILGILDRRSKMKSNMVQLEEPPVITVNA
jgi:hypothetical protein